MYPAVCLGTTNSDKKIQDEYTYVIYDCLYVVETKVD